MIKSVFNKKKLGTKKLVDLDTGEMLATDVPNITSFNVVVPDVVMISSKDYMIIDRNALNYIQERFNAIDMGRILGMTHMASGDCNILYNENDEPHDLKSLQETLELSRNRFKDFIKRLYDESIIAFLILKHNGKDCKFVMLNPFFVRSKKVIKKSCTNRFVDISK